MNKSKVIVPPPRPRTNRAQFLATVPKPDEASNNLVTPSSSDATKDLNFKVAPEFHERFKLEAVSRRMKMKDLLEASFQTFLETHPRSRKPM